MDRDSDFEKELEFEVVKEGEPDGADALIAEITKRHRQLPTNLRDALKPQSKTADWDDDSSSGSINRVDTLREEEACPYGLGNNDCGIDGGSCDVCGYQREPEGFDDPDLEKAREWDEQEEAKREKVQALKKRRQQQKGESEESKMNRPARPSFARAAGWPEGPRFTDGPKFIDSGSSVTLTDAEWSVIQYALGVYSSEGYSDMTEVKPILDKIEARGSRTSSVQQVQFLYELVGNGFDDMVDKFIQDEIEAGRADQDLMDAYATLQYQGPEAFREQTFKADPLGIDMVEQLYADDSPEDNPDIGEVIDRRNRSDRTRQRGLRQLGPRPATPDNWDYR